MARCQTSHGWRATPDSGEVLWPRAQRSKGQRGDGSWPAGIFPAGPALPSLALPAWSLLVVSLFCVQVISEEHGCFMRLVGTGLSSPGQSEQLRLTESPHGYSGAVVWCRGETRQVTNVGPHTRGWVLLPVPVTPSPRAPLPFPGEALQKYQHQPPQRLFAGRQHAPRRAQPLGQCRRARWFFSRAPARSGSSLLSWLLIARLYRTGECQESQPAPSPFTLGDSPWSMNLNIPWWASFTWFSTGSACSVAKLTINKVWELRIMLLSCRI